MSARRVLLTGATGFIGRHVLARLCAADGDDVHAVSSRRGRMARHADDRAEDRADDRAADRVGDRAIWHCVNLLEPGAPARLVRAVKPTHVIHLAWCVKPGVWATSPRNLEWLRATGELIGALVESDGARFVGAGTCLEYDARYPYCSEDETPILPRTLYGEVKGRAEQLLRSIPRARLSAAWARVFHVYGPGEHQERLLPYVITTLLRDRRALCTHGNQIRDYLYVEDAADALVATARSDFHGPINIASGVPIRIRDLVEAAARLVDRPDLVSFGERSGNEGDPPEVVANVERLRTVLKWQPAWDLHSGLERTVSWWKDRLRVGA